ncbi:MAG: DUF4360 domain-containing protein, partial [Pseudomonadota bacterium]
AVAHADSIYLGVPGYGGNGCPVGSASVTLAPDQKSLSIIFDSYQVQAGYGVNKRLDRKSCNIAIPVHVPQGFSMSIIDVDYRGFNSLPSGASSRFSVEYFFAGSQGPSYAKDFYGRLEGDYTITNKLGVTGLIWSPCGQDVNLRVNSSMLVKTNSRMQDALATVDTADFKAGMIYHLQWQRCR